MIRRDSSTPFRSSLCPASGCPSARGALNYRGLVLGGGAKTSALTSSAPLKRPAPPASLGKWMGLCFGLLFDVGSDSRFLVAGEGRSASSSSHAFPPFQGRGCHLRHPRVGTAFSSSDGIRCGDGRCCAAEVSIGGLAWFQFVRFRGRRRCEQRLSGR